MIILSYDCIFRFLLSRPNGNMSGCERRYARLHAMIFRLQPDSDVTGKIEDAITQPCVAG